MSGEGLGIAFIIILLVPILFQIVIHNYKEEKRHEELITLLKTSSIKSSDQNLIIFRFIFRIFKIDIFCISLFELANLPGLLARRG